MLVFGGVGVDRLARGAVDLDAGGAGGGEELCGGDGEGEDVGGMGSGDGVGLEVLFRLLHVSFYHSSLVRLRPCYTIVVPQTDRSLRVLSAASLPAQGESRSGSGIWKMESRGQKLCGRSTRASATRSHAWHCCTSLYYSAIRVQSSH